MNQKDKVILDFLEKNSRISLRIIAEELSVTEGAIRKRIASMQKKGILKRFTVDISTDSYAFLGIELKEYSFALEKVPELKNHTIYAIEGRFDYMIKVKSSKKDDINVLAEKLRSHEEISFVEVFFSTESTY